MYLIVKKKNIHHNILEDETLILYNIHESPSNYIIECNDDNHVNEFINRFKIKNFKIINSEFGALTSKKYKEKTIIEIKKCTIGTGGPVFIAGPCSIESEKQLYEIAYKIKKYGGNILRGGAFKPRTSPYDFQGLGVEGIKILYDIGSQLDLPIITEIIDIRDLDLFYNYVDIIQVGCRNVQNYALLKELGKINKPIFLKRGFSTSIKEFLLCAEYIMLNGNEKIILCERGIRTYNSLTRNTMDISAIPLLKEMTHLPVFADPSHATGIRTLIKPMSFASIASGADGLMIETHTNPEVSISDSKQAITPEMFFEIVESSNKIWKCVE